MMLCRLKTLPTLIKTMTGLRLLHNFAMICVMLLVTACTDNSCITSDPEASSPPSTPIVLSSSTSVSTATATPVGQTPPNPIWTAGITVTSGSSAVPATPTEPAIPAIPPTGAILIKVSGMIDGCPGGATPGGSTTTYPGDAFDYPTGFSSNYGPYYSVVSSNHNWVPTVTIEPGATMLLSIPPYYNSTALTPPSVLACSNGVSRGNYTITCNTACSAYGAIAPTFSTNMPTGCTTGTPCNCISSASCAPYTQPSEATLAAWDPDISGAYTSYGTSVGNCADLTFGNYWSPYGIFYPGSPGTRGASICQTIAWGDTSSTYLDSVTSFTQAFNDQTNAGWWLGGGIGLKMKLCAGQCDTNSLDCQSCTNNSCNGSCTPQSCPIAYNLGDFFVSGAGGTSDGNGYIGGIQFSPGPDQNTAQACGPSTAVGAKIASAGGYDIRFDPTRLTFQTITNITTTKMTLNLRIQDGDYANNSCPSSPPWPCTPTGYPASGPGNRPYVSYGDNIGGYNVHIMNYGPTTCPAVNGQPVAGQSYGGLLVQTLDITSSPPPTLQPYTSDMLINNVSTQITSGNCSAITNSLLSNVCASDSDLASGKAAYYYIPNPTAGTMNFTIYPNPSGDQMSGVLNITTYYAGTAGAFSNLVMEMLSLVQITLTDSTSKIFTNMTGNIDYIAYIRILLQLYIVLYGIMFLMGTTKISQFDLVVRVIKIAVIVELTSPNSWDFFSNTLFNLYIDGGAELINIFTSSTLASSSTSGESVAASNPFSFVDRMFNILFFGSGIWIRVVALMFSNALGWLYAILIIWGAVNYLFAIIEAVVEYVLAIVTVQILLVLAPIFIPFLLFGATKHLFESWLKFLFSFAIKPVILLIGLCIISNILVVITLDILSFTVCYHTYVNFGLGPITEMTTALKSIGNFGNFFFSIVLPTPQGTSNSGDGVSFLDSTEVTIAQILLFVLITKFMASLPVFVDQMTSRLSDNRKMILKTEGGPGGQSSTVAQRFMKSAKDSLLSTVGMDEASRSRRKTVARERGVKDNIEGAAVAKDPK